MDKTAVFIKHCTTVIMLNINKTISMYCIFAEYCIFRYAEKYLDIPLKNITNCVSIFYLKSVYKFNYSSNWLQGNTKLWALAANLAIL